MRGIKLLAAVVTAGLLLSACQGGGGAGTGELGSLTGTVQADGSSTVFPITSAVAELFNEEAPQVRVSVGTSGTGGGFEKFCSGETDISNASRPIKESEIQACASNNVEYVELQVAIDGLSVLVNPANDWVDCLTVQELEAIWSPDSQIERWNQVRPDFPNRPLSLYGPGTDSGTFDYFTEVIVGESGASRSDYVASEDDNVLVQGIAGDENALGYFGFAYFEQNQDKLKALAIDSGDGCVEPTRQTINSGEYSPLSRPVFIYVSKESSARPEVAAFVDFYFEVVSEVAAEVGFVALPEDELGSQVEKWEDFAA